MKPKDFSIANGAVLTKRIVMGIVSKIWNPYGYLLPITIRYRIDLQKTWQNGFSWDQPLPEEMINVWDNNIEKMKALDKVSIKRCLKPDRVIGLPQLHAFCDGSNEAYGSCCFIRWNNEDGIKVKFVTAKAFVAPFKLIQNYSK